MDLSTQSFNPRFSAYFARDVAERAAKTLADGAEIEFRIEGSDGSALETFSFTRAQGKNLCRPTPAQSPQLIFRMTPLAAQAILEDESNEIGQIGIHIAKWVLSPDANKKVHIQFKSGFLTLFNKGYLGVIGAGGAEFAAFLASKGLSGMSAIKTVLSKFKQ
jgi:hypothetical protein